VLKLAFRRSLTTCYKASEAVTKGSRPVKRAMSASARRKIAAAQRLRWATVRVKQEKKAA